MNSLEELKQEHENIERELIELEAITDSPIINFPNLCHVFKKLCEIWNPHEEKEERIFPILEKAGIKIPVEEILFEHRDLRSHKEAMLKAINSGENIRETLQKHGKAIIKKLRKHIDDEDKILYTISLEEFTSEQILELEKKVLIK